MQYQKKIYFKRVKANLSLLEQGMVWVLSNLWEFITGDYKAMGMTPKQLELIWERANTLELTSLGTVC